VIGPPVPGFPLDPLVDGIDFGAAVHPALGIAVGTALGEAVALAPSSDPCELVGWGEPMATAGATGAALTEAAQTAVVRMASDWSCPGFVGT
jgi:hypothetical protein